MIEKIHLVKSALGVGQKIPQLCEADTARVARRSIVAVKDIGKDCIITEDMLAVKRPGTGIAPRYWGYFIGKRVLRRIASDQLIRWEHVQ